MDKDKLMKNLLTFLFLLFSVAVFAQPVRTTITDDGVNVTISTPVNTRVVPICDFHWTFVDGNLQMWIEGRNELIPGGRLGNFTINGATTQGTKLAALGAISDQCSGGGIDSLYLSDGTLLVSGDTIPALPADLSTLPAAFSITSSEKIVGTDSTLTFQKLTNQLRDSTLIGVETVEAIMNLPSTTPEFSRILVKNTGATFLVVDSVDIKVSDTVDDFASTSPVSGSVWVYKSDTTAVVKILGTTKYAIYDPIAGAIPISRFSKSSLNDSESLQKAIDYSFWVRNMYRNNNTNVTTAISPVMANKVLVDKDLELTDSIYIRYGTIIEGISLPGLDRYYEPVLKFNLNSATRNGTFLDQFGGATTGKSGELRNLRFEATSAINAMVNLNYPNDFSVYNVKLDGGASRFAKYGLKTFSFVHEEIYDLSVKDVSDAAVYLSRENSNIGTTITLNDLKVIECKYGILADSASTYDLYVNRPSFETVDSSILSLARGIRAYISEIYTEGCTAFNIIKVGTGTSGGSTSGKYFISNSKIETNLSVSSGSIINSNFVELLDVSNVEMSGKLTSITTTSSTALLNLRNVTMNDITTNTAAFDRGALTGVNSATNVNVDNVLVSSLGYGAGTINSKKVRTALIDDTALSLRGTYNIQYATSAGSGAREIVRRLAGTQLSPSAVPSGATIATKDWEAYVGSVTGNIVAARISVSGNGGAVTDAAGGFPSDMYIGLCNGTVAASGNNILQIRGNTSSVGIGTYPDRKLHSEVSSAVTNTVEYAQRLSHITSGTTAANFGVGLEYELENASGTNRVASTQEITYSDATNATEDATYTLKLMRGGTLTEALNISSVGVLSTVGGTFSGRIQAKKGSDIASANDLTLGSDGNVFTITGTTQINAITTTNWQAGSEITLIFASTPAIKNNTAGGVNTAAMLLAGGADFSATANDVLKLVYDGTNWLEVSRSVN